jgi:acyl-CoA synthetase (AMP-forming)/AMP-acid ligase II
MLFPITDAPALVDAPSGTVITFAELNDRVMQRASELPQHAGLVVLAMEQTVESIVDFLALLKTGQPVVPTDPTLSADRLATFVDHYAADVVIDRVARWSLPQPYFASAPGVFERPFGPPSHPDLAVLLSTSGSTGSSKLVRLSANALGANATAIGTSLHLRATDRAPTLLPLHYIYGLSVLLSHFAAGASIVVTARSVIEPEFWTDFEATRCTLLNAVPYTFHMLRRTGFYERELPDLRAVTQAGGKFHPDSMQDANERLRQMGAGLYVMYGQTEAAPRIACLAPADLQSRFGSVGQPLGGGAVTIVDELGSPRPPGEIGEIVYSGPNVMLGYADCRDHLGLGDVNEGVLHTGDLGYLDEDNFLYLTGRLKRIGKVFGVRLNLDEIEAMLPDLAPVAVVQGPDSVLVFTERADSDVGGARKQLAAELKVPVAAVKVRVIHRIPLLSNGKPDYLVLTGED